MSKVLKMTMLVISALFLILPAYAQEAPKEAARKAAVANEAPMDQPDEERWEESEEHSVERGNDQGTDQAEDESKDQAKDHGDQARDQSKDQGGQAKDRAKDQGKDQGKGLDEQVQEIKTDVLSIAAELNRLEEKLLYPSDTQIAIFVSIPGTEKFRLDAVDISLDGKSVAHHLYTFKELEALKKGGVQRIYVGNVRTGEHPLQVTVLGKSEGGSDFKKEESFKIAKGIGPKLVGVELAGPGIGSKTITLKDW